MVSLYERWAASETQRPVAAQIIPPTGMLSYKKLVAISPRKKSDDYTPTIDTALVLRYDSSASGPPSEP
jgi:hypothetical protein